MKIYSKYLFDLGVAPGVSSPRRNDSNYMLEFSRNNKENFVAVLNYNNLLRINSTKLLNRESLLLLSVLLSADYHIYVIKGLGKEKSYQLASIKIPNFTGGFYNIFDSSKTGNTWDIQYHYGTFQEDFVRYCQRHSTGLFSRHYSVLFGNENENFENWPPIQIINHYLNPVKDEDINIETYLDKNLYLNVEVLTSYNQLQFDEIFLFLQKLRVPQVTNFDKWFRDTMHENVFNKVSFI